MNQLVRSSNAAHRKRAIAIVIASTFLLVLPSCGIPRLRNPKPSPDLPGDFKGSTSTENSSQVRIEEFFNDPMLTDLIHQATIGNQELRIRGEEIQIASNEIMARQGAYLPFVTLNGGAGVDKPSRFTREGSVDAQLDISPGRPIPNPLPSFVLGPMFFWTPDIWRQLHNAKDAAANRYFATSEARNDLVTRLVAEIADNYYRLMALDQRLEILDQTILLFEQSLGVARKLKEAARGTELAVQRFEAEVRRNQSEKLIVIQDIIEAENRINFLVGRFPQPVQRMSGNFIDLNLHALSVGIPSQLLQNRPDIRQAEREITASGLDVKVARKRFYPAATITSGVGYSSFNPAYLFITPQALVAQVAGNFITPFINKKAIRADYLSANARQLEAVYQYQRVVINAFTEVINRLSKVENYRKSIERKKQQLASLEFSVDLASKLFQNARAEYLDVLYAQRDLRDARTILVETKQQELSAIADTYQALGGGSYLLPIFVPKPLQDEHKHHLWHTHGGEKAVGGPAPPPPPAAEVGAALPPASPAADGGAAPPPPPAGERGPVPPPASPAADGGPTTPPAPPAGERGPSQLPDPLPVPPPTPLGGGRGSVTAPSTDHRPG